MYEFGVRLPHFEIRKNDVAIPLWREKKEMTMKQLMKSPAVRRWFMAMLMLVIAVSISACGEKSTGGDQTAGDSIKIVTTTGMIKDIVEHVGGTYVSVEALMGAGVDPHLYKASQGDIKKLDQADIVFYNGLHLEGKMVDILEKLNQSKPSVPVSRNLTEAELLSDPEGGADAHDPHIWFNVQLWMKATEVVRDTLVEKDAAHADAYKQQADSYLAKLRETDEYARAQMQLIPAESRVLVTAHDAFHYFGKAYGVEVKGLQGLSTASEYGSKDVSDLRDYLIEHKIKAVFVESSVPTKSIEAVVEGAKKKGHTVNIGGELFSDAMGRAGTEEGTYIGMVRHNVDTIVAALK